MEHRCLHEKEIILLVDHSEETRQNIKLILKLLNGEAGIITTQSLHEQSLIRLWSVVKYAGGSLGAIIAGVTITLKYFGG